MTHDELDALLDGARGADRDPRLRGAGRRRTGVPRPPRPSRPASGDESGLRAQLGCRAPGLRPRRTTTISCEAMFALADAKATERAA